LGFSVKRPKATPFAGTTAPVRRTCPGTTGRIGSTAAVIVVHGWQSGSDGAISQGIGYRSTSSLATHLREDRL